MVATMADRPRPLQRLLGDQARAAAPAAHVWLSASAGTGKTHVLTARVFRLLLQGVRPENILCLTFTKAGAAEMADRIHDRLAGWVQMDGPALAADLMALGEDHDPAMQDKARRLFAEVLESTGGGLRIQTIHGFCQQLLAAFPLEADLAPGFRPMDQREQASLARATLADLSVRAQEQGDERLIGALQALSLRLGEGGAERFLLRCAGSGEALETLPDSIAPWLASELGLPDGDIDEWLGEQCSDALFDMRTLDGIVRANVEWGKGRGLERCDRIAAWRALDPAARAAGLADLHRAWAKADGDLIDAKGWVPPVDGYLEMAARLHDRCREMIAVKLRADYAALLAQALHAGRAYARDYAQAKVLAGAVDFDDLIARTARLLEQDGIAEWIRYKLDQRIDHILVDEAQDTNAAQWRIVRTLAEEFFANEWEAGQKVRTIFTVGDFKQAIFGFQGTSPANFAAAQILFQHDAVSSGHDFFNLSLDQSFRSTPAVLDVVDRTIATLRAERLGLEPGDVRHISANRHPGEVLLWKPVVANLSEEAEGEEDWVADQERVLAARIAGQIRQWIDDGLMLESRGRPVRAGDIMILVRRRSELARLIVARLYEEQVAVAGIDRLRLNAPLAVRDLLAALRFAVQPDDELNLASLLVSPLIGWSQDELMERLIGRRVPLWRHLNQTLSDAQLAPLRGLLAAADFTTPYRYLEAILSGPIDGRRRLVERLGIEAADPIEELLNAALAFEGEAHPSLQRFIDWFDRGEVEIVRDAAGQGDMLRLLTVHGAKGLQAPIVILADACMDPDAGQRADSLEWNGLPIIAPRKGERQGPIGDVAEQAAAEERREHWRLLYVALTRAEEKLVVAGALGPRAKGEVKPESWFAAVEAALVSLGAEWEADPLWGATRRWRGTEALPARKAERESGEAPPVIQEPAWLHAPAPVEARPPRPLAPSAAVEDDVPYPPPSPAMRAAAERGRWLHRLFERLPDLPADRRRDAADRWLAQQGAGDAAVRRDVMDQALRVIEAPAFADLFAPDALAEAPIAAVVGEAVIAGTVDRLHIGDDHVQLVDFKTGRIVPQSPDDAPLAHVRQMAAYVAALEVIFPGRTIKAGLLYTSGPHLLTLPPDLLARHKPGFVPAQENLPLWPVEPDTRAS
ncbi:MAG TPA: double-strand break repair helicase AddA [Sphingobium sp.]|uniref:double-strand break repair helicase AddA n=1 Tax=unclassified Sphingobium TaxID=2611147 RepID=UPI0007F3369E|nr:MULTISPECIES: double-strand break repair helicase AddA [unclassified Sphingobium]OAN56435.1 double-strand break repair helicase AddA [Sphingobium sp. TCM1]HAF40399.1 double-strand break repair helicase AddA [Sphingobium sp.]